MILLDSVGWKPNPFLFSKIRFKPPVIDQLAREVGIEPRVLDLLKKLGVTSEAELRARLGVKEEAMAAAEAASGGDGSTPKSTPPVPGPTGSAPPRPGDGGGGPGRGVGAESDSGRPQDTRVRGDEHGEGRSEGSDQASGTRTRRSPGGMPFVSYVGTHPDDDEADPDGLDQSARMALEARAVDLILAREPNWHRTPPFNPGYDLFEAGPDAQPNRWCEVKAMTGGLGDRPVGLSRAQFECAREHGEDYWLYVVEHAGEDDARIVRIQDPVGKARTFTFDHGWINVAEPDGTTA